MPPPQPPLNLLSNCCLDQSGTDRPTSPMGRWQLVRLSPLLMQGVPLSYVPIRSSGRMCRFLRASMRRAREGVPLPQMDQDSRV